MKLAKVLLSVLALCTLIVAGCTDNPVVSGSKTDLLTAVTWKTTSFKVNGTDQTATALQTTKFNSDKTYSGTYASGSKNGTWEFNVDETSLIMDKADTTRVDWNILALTSTSLKLKANTTIQGTSYVTEYEGVPQ